MAVVFFVLFMAIALAMTGMVWRTLNQREKEKQLLAVGDEIRTAIGRYYESSPGSKQYPQSLEDLLQDKRFPQVRRYLRKIYADPMTGKQEWGYVSAPGQGILGVYSLSAGQPLKAAKFDRADRAFEGAKRYAQWVFSYLPGDSGMQAGSNDMTSEGQYVSDAAGANAGANAGLNPNPPSQADADVPAQRSYCQNLLAEAQGKCSEIRSKLGAERGDACDALAQSQYGACLASVGVYAGSVFVPR